MSAPLVNRSLATLKTELEFLRDSEVITEGFYNQIVEKLPHRYQAVPQPTNESSNNAEYVEAIYDYRPQQPEDLEFRAGDKIQVLEHTSPDWWKGAIGSRSGMFPSNYVKKLEERRQAPSPAPAYRSNELQPQPTNQSQQYAPPPHQQPPYMYQQPPYGSSQQVQYPPYQGSPYQQQPVQYQQPQQQEVVVQQQQQGEGGGHLKKFGSKLGNAAIFGAGATIGSDIVNSIF
ncbi:hypothetical protein WICANDRAFT_37070 [Wickerhamomyces anomalus NRRL Y-366-8]|uniref:SH3 domain-containing protein n=1 Tax=Wickerhamomyces anomalus (strain ATCC 58044 / CBS 1984 / NCYC 433 / NRRL Y-366-8) TaxID=683960 RepID=A0A1E3NU51_WICAA|nr:uncharacterized protein WICANDRAFT_37070 [Wickerhamomyces anomalus NRRL Y-366-8]ODQ56699.1 hypothetical protein WICANDRAFT_37070 [Wickerhamomyces anomalus NRRL Y-366-8]